MTNKERDELLGFLDRVIGRLLERVNREFSPEMIAITTESMERLVAIRRYYSELQL